MTLNVTQGEKAELTVQGGLHIIAEEDTGLNIKTDIIFDNQQIKLRGAMTGVY